MELVGRDLAFASLNDALAEAMTGRGRLVVISGEAGIGKSAMCDALAVRAPGVAITRDRAWEFADSPPYFAVRGCLRSLGIAADDDASPFDLWDDVLDALAHDPQPRLWIVEDAHAADLLTLDLLAFLARPIRTLPVLIVVTRRDRDPRLTPAGEQRLVRMARDGDRLQLGPLDAQAIEQLACSAAGRVLPRATVQRLVELTAGNPLFVVEYARALDTAGASLPDTLRQVVLERLALLSDSARDIVLAAAVLGREFSAAVLGRLLDRTPARVIDDLAPAIRAGIVVEESPAWFAFSHVIVRDAIEEAASRAARAELHRKAIDAYGNDDSPAGIVERARHALEAVDVELDPVIVDRAIDLLVERGAHDRAFALASRLDRVRRDGKFSGGDRLRLAELAVAAGQSTEARRLCDEIIADARTRGDFRLLARAALLVGTELRPGTIDSRLISLLEEPRAHLDDDALACRVDARLAAARQPAPDRSQPIALAEAAIARARTLGDPELLCEVIEVAGSAMVYFTPIARRLEISGELLAIARAIGDRPRQLRAHARAALDRVELGDFAMFSTHVDDMLAISLALGLPRHRWRALLMASMRAVAEGRFAESERLTFEVDQIAAMVDEPALDLSLFAHTSQRSWMFHHDEASSANLARFGDSVPNLPLGHVMAAIIRASALAQLEDRDATIAQLTIIAPAFREVATSTSFHHLLTGPIAFAGTDGQRRMLLDVFSGSPTPDLVAGHVAVHYDGPVCYHTGRLHASLGDLSTAERELRRALAIAEGRGHRLWTALITYELACALRDDSLLDKTVTLAAEIGMTGLVARARARTGRSTAPAKSAAPTIAIVRDGDVWRIGDLRVKDSRGMQLLARLVDHPGEEIHVLALASDEPGASLRDRDTEALIDPRARRAYKARLDELDDELARADARGDLGRRDALSRARDALVQELARAVGLGGSARRSGSASERARVNVQRRIKDAIARIGEADPALGRYLDAAVRTGTYCAFRP